MLNLSRISTQCEGLRVLTASAQQAELGGRKLVQFIMRSNSAAVNLTGSNPVVNILNLPRVFQTLYSAHYLLLRLRTVP